MILLNHFSSFSASTKSSLHTFWRITGRYMYGGKVLTFEVLGLY